MEQIAVISDIHANLEALKTVLADIKRRNIKHILCLGDIVGKGIHPKECVDLILSNCEVVVRGNLEEFVAKTPDPKNIRQITYIKQLGEEYIDKVRNLSFCHEVYISGSFVRLFHASPKDVTDRVNELENPKQKLRVFQPSDKTLSQKIADTVIFGDLHTPFMQKFYNKTLINTGSVGCSTDIYQDGENDSNSMETTQANYLVIEGVIGEVRHSAPLNFNFVRLPYDIDKELSDIGNLLEKEAYINELKKGSYRDVAKLKQKLQNQNS